MTPTSRLPGRFHGPTYCTLRGQTDQRAIEGMLLLTQHYPVAEWALPLSGATLQSERQRQELVQAIGWLCAPLSDQGNALRANVCLQLDLQATQMLLDGQMDLCGIVGKPGAQVQRVQICPPLGLTDAQERRMATILRAWPDITFIAPGSALSLWVRMYAYENRAMFFSHPVGADLRPMSDMRGFSGSLSPESLERELPWAHAAVDGHPYWIDLGSQAFDLQGRFHFGMAKLVLRTVGQFMDCVSEALQRHAPATVRAEQSAATVVS